MQCECQLTVVTVVGQYMEGVFAAAAAALVVVPINVKAYAETLHDTNAGL